MKEVKIRRKKAEFRQKLVYFHSYLSATDSGHIKKV